MTLACSCRACGKPFEAAPFGGSRLMCGDATDPAAVAALTGGGLADLCFTSPPYAQQRAYAGGSVEWDALMRGVFALLPMRPGGQVLVNLGLVHRDSEVVPYWDGWIEWMRGQGWRRFGWYVWDQGPGLPGDWNGRLAPAHEFVFHFNRIAEKARKTVPAKWAGVDSHTRKDGHSTGMRNKAGRVGGWSDAGKGRVTQSHRVPDSVIRVPVEEALTSVIHVMRHKARGIEVQHPAVFPVKLATEVHAAFSDAGNVIYEPFAGAGTSIIAAFMAGRRCWAMEIAPVYADVAVRRFELFTGSAAVLQGSGLTFAHAAALRTSLEAV